MLQVVQLNLAYDARFAAPGELLAAYHTLTGWSAALVRAGAVVRTIQRFGLEASGGSPSDEYLFVADGPPGTPAPWDTFNAIIAAVTAARPDVVHINSLLFPGMLEALRDELPETTAVVLQDHSGVLPRQLPWPIKPLVAGHWRRALALADACTFTAAELAERWHQLGLPRETPILEIPEASTTITPVPREDAVRATGIDASPAILWVGRLDANKDPLTALEALERGLPALSPDARCWMVYQDGALEPEVRRRIGATPLLRERVTLVGAVPHDRMPAFYSAADIFLSASRHEGSGYALIEALACGVSPCVTDIPAFRALTGDCGARWQVGDASGGAAALTAIASRDPRVERGAAREHFAERLDWDVIGRRTLSEYRRLAARRRG